MPFRKGQARPAGSGRQSGTPNRLTSTVREIAERAAIEGITPLEYMLAVMRDESNPLPVRLDAAKAAAPYVHARLQAVEVTGRDGEAIETRSRVMLYLPDNGRAKTVGA